MSISSALKSLCPTAQWSMVNDDYSTIVWHVEPDVIPTQAQVDAAAAELAAEAAATAYQRNRQPEYPPITDLADALYWASEGDSTKLDEYYAACAAVKAKYPKEAS